MSSPFPLHVTELNTVVHSWLDLAHLLKPFYGEFRYTSIQEDEEGGFDVLLMAEDGEVGGCYLTTNLHINDNYFMDDVNHAKPMYELTKENPNAVIYYGIYPNFQSLLPKDLLQLCEN